MDELSGLRVTELLCEARTLASCALECVPLPSDPVDAEALGLLRSQLDAMEEAIGMGAPAPGWAAEPVWQAAGAILVLDVERADEVADRLEVIGDQISGALPIDPLRGSIPPGAGAPGPA